jgi:hypothetical protein
MSRTGQPDAPLQQCNSVGGGSAKAPRPAQHGGGYQDICTKTGARIGAPAAPAAAADPRLAELRRVGLPQPWPRVAAVIGFDAFMTLWQALATVDVAGSRDRVVMPKLSTYMRYQRNQLMRSLAAEGLDLDQIRQHLTTITSDVPTTSHIRRILDEA